MKLTWFGHSAFRLDLPGASLLIDPFFTGNPAFEGNAAEASKGVSHIVITHGHGDHIGDTLAIAEANHATVVTNFDLCMYLASKGLKKFEPMNTGGTVDLGAFQTTLVRADHSAGLVEAGVGYPLGSANGAVIKAPGEKTLWHMGDTDIFPGMALISELNAVDICICPIGDRFTMGAKTAALAMTRFVKPKVAIPCHYGSFPIIAENADEFVAALKGSDVRALVPGKGEAVEI
ncbi:metal-dependent hydrolase [Bosea sp. BIWAKO-01]|uniref:metal-dependent hydrolase n=1 Tax=Bosea sp. BIWAKO-01 TaxID=506668 RepID=UPI000852CD38|nr:metal-dependent hydrolase [Bosea sp. BIWAKO-01]GAU85206.1 metallo-beta-lactamase family protein [Bosea sp. BIWAKO-01]